LADAPPRRRLRVGWGVLAAWATLALVAAAFWNQWLTVPDRWNPWAPLWPEEAPTFLTGWKLARLAQDPAACRATLQATRLEHVAVSDRPVREGCGWSNGVRLTGLPARVEPPVVLACPAAVALALWDRHGVQPLAREHLGQPVVAVANFGSFACRNVGGEAGQRRSEHASANALDVAGFTLADGRTVSVARHWAGEDARGRFLRQVHGSACRFWTVALGPDYNAAHADHFHLDRGPFRACR
jgi:hypothetical protein